MNWKRISWLVAIETAILMVGSTLILPGGEDLQRYYVPFAAGCVKCGFMPHPAQWLLWPLALIPTRIIWTVWTAVSITGWLVICRYTQVNPAILMLSFPMFGQWWLGQVDVLVCVGLVLAMHTRNPYARGVGIALALVKPQLSIIPIIYLLLGDDQWLDTLIVPVAAALTSVAMFGVLWPLDWITNTSSIPEHAWRLASGDVWKFALGQIWAPLLFSKRGERINASIMLSAMATPFTSVYSYVLMLATVKCPWWTIPLSFIWVLAYPIMGASSMRLAWILPASLLAWTVYGLKHETISTNSNCYISTAQR